MLFPLFVLLCFVLLVRPEELFGDFAGGRLYFLVITICLPFAAPRILNRLANLRDDPVSCCVLAYYFSVVASCIGPLGFDIALSTAIGFGKVIIAYFVAMATLETPRNYLRFLSALPLLIAGIVIVGLLNHHEVLVFASITPCVESATDQNGEPYKYLRLVSAGIFNDPNDLCLAISVGLAFCAYHLIERASALSVVMSLALVPLFLYSLVETKSRGGLLSVAAMIGWICLTRFSIKIAAPLGLAGVVGLAAISGGRQTSFDSSSGTAQARLQHWAEGLESWQHAPILGIGHGKLVEEIGLVAHNSYVQAFAETGYLGGTSFMAIFLLLGVGLVATPRIDDDETTDEEREINRSRPFAAAALVGYCAGMYSLTRNIMIPTYLVAAVANACLWASHPPSERTWFVMNGAMLRWVAAAGAAALIALKLFVMTFVRYG